MEKTIETNGQINANHAKNRVKPWNNRVKPWKIEKTHGKIE